MGAVTFSIPKDFITLFHKFGHFQNFVETGTFTGVSCFWAATLFDAVFTVEIDPEISKATASRPDCPKNIRFFVGNSRNVLPSIVTQLKGRSIFWLDGHWCDVSELGKDEECPVLDELKAAAAAKDPLILIDDARAFLGPLPPPHQKSHWPRIDEIFSLSKVLLPKHLVTVFDDVIFVIPPDLIECFEKYWIGSYYNRFPGKNQPLLKRVFGKALSFWPKRKS